MKTTLKEFYIELQAALDSNTEPYWFSDSGGLCHNLDNWLMFYRVDLHVQVLLKQQMRSQFLAETGRVIFPFQTDKTFLEECSDGTIFSNPKRLAWVKKHAEEAK